MKKLFTLMLMAIIAIVANAQSPLYTIATKVSADEEWGEEYASSFAFKGTAVTVDVYGDDYVIVHGWAGAEGCDLKLEFDSSIDVDDDDCMGNIIAITSIIDGVEQEARTYEKEEDGYTYSYYDIATGRTDYPIASLSLNEDGTFYWSFIELDHEAREGYVELTAYFLSADYSECMTEGYYYVGWPYADEVVTEPTGLGCYNAHVIPYQYEDEETGETVIDTESYGTSLLSGFDVQIEVCEGYVHIQNWSNNPASPRDLIVYAPNDESEGVSSVVYISETGTQTQITASKPAYIYTGYKAANYTTDYAYSMYLYPSYSYAGWDADGGYVLLVGYTYTKNIETGETNDYKWGHYFVVWEATDYVDGITQTSINDAHSAAIYNLSGQRVNASRAGLYIVGGRKVVVR